jgi:Cu/Ag efflux pump CusA
LELRFGLNSHLLGLICHRQRACIATHALVGALLATFTVTPCLASLLLPERVSEVETIVVRGLRRVYTPVLRWSLSHRRITVVIGFVFLAISGLLGSRLGSEFLPTLEEGNLLIRASMPSTISLEAGMPIVSQIREILRRHPEVITVVSQHGRPDNGSDAAGFFNAEFFVPLKPFEEWPAGLTKEKLVDELQAEFSEKFVGINFNFSQYIQDNVEEGLSGVKGANSIKIVGPDLATLERIAKAAMDEMAKVPGITDLGAFWVLGQPNLNIKADRERAARYGLNAGDMNSVVQAASISAAIGFISLFGVSVMSGILIIHGYERVAGPGVAPVDALFLAVGQQMRPILMMTLSAYIGLLPAALSTGIGSQVQRPLAAVIVGGMLIGPIMLLVIVPALQTYFLGPELPPEPRPREREAEQT